MKRRSALDNYWLYLWNTMFNIITYRIIVTDNITAYISFSGELKAPVIIVPTGLFAQ